MFGFAEKYIIYQRKKANFWALPSKTQVLVIHTLTIQHVVENAGNLTDKVWNVINLFFLFVYFCLYLINTLRDKTQDVD
jgi:hypothetical protein